MTSVVRWVEVHRLAVAGREAGSQNRIDAVKRDATIRGHWHHSALAHDELIQVMLRVKRRRPS
jgi:hypothetical protein